MKNTNLSVRGWRDYELIDSGDNQKLERFGEFLLIRPETQAIWKPARPAEWKKAHAEFRFTGGKGSWRGKTPESWNVSWNDAHFMLRLTSFKHVGIFPEQAANWEWLAEKVSVFARNETPPQVLNLFGYTGGASLVAAKHGAHVTHVDASKQSNAWAKENATLSQVASENIRYIFDDAFKFAEREVRRGATYQGIILDPPAFGRGAKGEVWKIEERMPALLDVIAKLLVKTTGAFFLLNGYAAGYAPQSFLQATESSFPEIKNLTNGEFGELRIEESGGDRVVPSGIYVRFTR